MKLKGYFYITKVIGDRDCDANGKRCSASVVAQYQWQSGRSQTSKIWNNCQDWAVDGSGHCNRLGSDTRVSVLSKSLYYGQIAVIVGIVATAAIGLALCKRQVALASSAAAGQSAR